MDFEIGRATRFPLTSIDWDDSTDELDTHANEKQSENMGQSEERWGRQAAKQKASEKCREEVEYRWLNTTDSPTFM